MSKEERIKIGLLKIGEIAREAGVLKTTVRYYTEVGLLEVVDKTPGGYRLYQKNETLAKIRQIKSIMAQNRTLWEIKTELTEVFA